jgi:uncharacterized coiled-coil protein SlyX
VAVIALGVVVVERVVASHAPMSHAPLPSVSEAPAVNSPPVADPRVATLQHDLSETRRVLDDAQSALGQRDREIATANDELRVLRQELEALRAKNAAPTP